MATAHNLSCCTCNLFHPLHSFLSVRVHVMYMNVCVRVICAGSDFNYVATYGIIFNLVLNKLLFGVKYR